MGWLFNKNDSKKDSNHPSEMSPIEAVTYICTAIQLSDGEIDFSEKNIWEEMISELFPDFSDQRALKFFTDAQLILNKKSSDEKNIFINEVLKRIKTLLNNNQIEFFGNQVSKLIEADGIVMSGEIEIAKLIENVLNIKIKIDHEL